MRTIRIAMFVSLLMSILAGCQKKDVRVDFLSVQQYVVENLNTVVAETMLVAKAETIEERRAHFILARNAWKRAEPFAQYLNADNAHRVNGPPLPVFREDNGKVLPSISLQSVDEQLYADEPLDTALLSYRAQILKGYLENLKSTAKEMPIEARRYFVPVHLQFMRIFALSSISFDTPSSLRGLDEAIVALQGVKDVYKLAIADTVEFLDPQLHDRFLNQIDEAVEYIAINNDFETFNRYEFGREHINSLTKSWVDIRKTTGLFEDPKIYALNLDAPTFFETNSFNPEDFRSSYNISPTGDQIAVGQALFFDPRLSATGNLSCASCHNPEHAYQDGLTVGMDKEGNPLKRNTPTIINTVFQRKFFWDGRSDNLEQQISDVFNNEKEFDSQGHRISFEILKDSTFAESLRTAYPDRKISKNEVIKALASYTSTLNGFNSRFDKNMRGESDDFTELEIKGMNLFMGKALCATCHFVPLTNGTVPPTFSETEKEILGIPETAENLEVDDDLGFYWVFNEDIHKYMFKTPTIRNIQHTAPYMHNGVYETLEEVMDFYNRGGGGGMGFELEHQTLPFDSLGLQDDEIEAIIAFMKTFSDLESVSKNTGKDSPDKLAALQ